MIEEVFNKPAYKVAVVASERTPRAEVLKAWCETTRRQA